MINLCVIKAVAVTAVLIPLTYSWLLVHVPHLMSCKRPFGQLSAFASLPVDWCCMLAQRLVIHAQTDMHLGIHAWLAEDI
jgi:hypothetical protein